MMADTLAVSGQIGEAELSRIIGVVLGEKGIRSVGDLVNWFETGRRGLLKDVGRAAKELGVMPTTLRTVVSSQAFRAAYFQHVLSSGMDPDTLAKGISLLAADMTSPKTAPKDRLAIIRAVAELMGVKTTQKVEHEIKQTSMEIKFHLVASPNDLIDGEEPVVLDTVQPGVSEGELGHALPVSTGVVSEADFEEAEEALVGEEVK